MTASKKVLLFSLLFSATAAFSLFGRSNPLRHTRLTMSSLDETVEQAEGNTSPPKQRSVSVPLSWDEMVRQVSSAMKEAQRRGQRRQIVRVLLPRDSNAGSIGKFFESEASASSESMSLVPPDESWYGGIMQLYRAAAPTAEKILREMTSSAGLPPRISEDRSVDESGVDGVGLFSTDDKSFSCFVQPTQETIDYIEDAAARSAEDQTILLLNPQWRLVDDALDTYSKNEGFFGNLANFLGGKGSTLKRLQDAGFAPVYTFEGYVCRGANVRLLQVLDSEWNVFCERDTGGSFVAVGSTPRRPTYQQVDEMLSKSNIGYKYARDIGLEPKL